MEGIDREDIKNWLVEHKDEYETAPDAAAACAEELGADLDEVTPIAAEVYGIE